MEQAASLKQKLSDELKQAMKSQLVDRYLADSECRHGLYVVAWFTCDQWDDQDSRRKKTGKWELHEARQFFEKQASELSGDDVKVEAFVLDAAFRST